MANTTWSPADVSHIVLSGGNLVASSNFSAAGVRAVNGLSSGKYYWEYTLTTLGQFTNTVGLALIGASYASLSGNMVGVVGLGTGSGDIWVNNTTSLDSLGARAQGNVIGVAADFTARLIWFRVAPSGNWNGSGAANPATGTGGVNISALSGALFPMFGVNGGGDVVTANFGDSAFVGAVPSGYTAGWPVSAVAVAQARVMVLA